MCGVTKLDATMEACQVNPSFCSQEESPPDDVTVPPSTDHSTANKWRMNPVETFSDWKIEIVTVNEGDDEASETAGTAETVTTYNVHKCHLAVGSRRSEYFVTLFKSPDLFETSKSCTSRIELDPLAARSFPALLDYIYAPEQPLEVTTETATALHQLGEYFEILPLCWDAKQFCKSDVSLANAEIYYKHGTLFKNDTVLSIVAKFLGENIKDVTTDSPMVQKTDYPLWVKASKAVDPVNAVHWSEVANQVGHAYMDTLDKATFQDISVNSQMPKVSPDVALDLCELEDNLQSDDLKEDEDHLSSLQERCATSISENWKELETYDQDVLTNLKRRKASFLVDMLVKCLEEYRCELRETNQELHKTKEVLKKFKPLTKESVLIGGSKPIPKDILDINPDETGMFCRQTQASVIQNGYIQTGWDDFPVFFFSDH